jgi:GGDEF domain-containing protein
MSEAPRDGCLADLPHGPSVLDTIVRKLRSVLDCDGASVLLCESARPLAYPCAASDGLVGPFLKGHTVPASQTPLIPGRRGWVLVEDGAGPNNVQELTWAAELRSSLWLTVTDRGGEAIGALALFDRRASRFTGDEAPLLELIADQIREVVGLYARIDGVALLDERTGLRCAAYGRRQLAEEVERSARYGSLLSAVVLRVDGLATSRDLVDELSRAVGGAVLATTRASDQASVLTEDTFLVVAPETDAVGALSVTSRLVECVWTALPEVHGLRVAAGTATTASGATTPDELINAAALNARRAGSESEAG